MRSTCALVAVVLSILIAVPPVSAQEHVAGQQGAEVRKKQGQVEIKLPFVTSSLLPTEIQARMPATAQIVEYAALDDRIVIWVITNKEIKYEVKSIDAQALTEKVSAFLETVTQPPGSGDDNFKERAAELYK